MLTYLINNFWQFVKLSIHIGPHSVKIKCYHLKKNYIYILNSHFWGVSWRKAPISSYPPPPYNCHHWSYFGLLPLFINGSRASNFFRGLAKINRSLMSLRQTGLRQVNGGVVPSNAGSGACCIVSQQQASRNKLKKPLVQPDNLNYLSIW